MFKEVSVNPKLDVHQSDVSMASPSSRASMGADELMDELFGDLEDYLDDPDSVDSVALATTAPSQSGHALLESSWRKGLSARRHSEDDLLVAYTPMDSTLALKQDVEASLSLDLLAEKESQKVMGMGKRLLVSSACISLAGLSMFWVGRQLRLQHAPAAAVSPPAIAVLPEVPPETVAFADYVSHSLERIDRETKAKKVAPKPEASAVSLASRPRVGLPNLPNTPNVSVASPNATSIANNNVERVYVPVAEVPTPNQKAQPPALSSTLPVLAAAKAAPAPAKQETLPVVKPLPMTPPSNGERKFLGGTNFGEQPVFMVSINGSTRHVKLGEAIDETGATFVEFDGEQSVLKQGNQLRSVTAGQPF